MLTWLQNADTNIIAALDNTLLASQVMDVSEYLLPVENTEGLITEGIPFKLCRLFYCFLKYILHVFVIHFWKKSSIMTVVQFWFDSFLLLIKISSIEFSRKKNYSDYWNIVYMYTYDCFSLLLVNCSIVMLEINDWWWWWWRWYLALCIDEAVHWWGKFYR